MLQYFDLPFEHPEQPKDLFFCFVDLGLGVLLDTHCIEKHRVAFELRHPEGWAGCFNHGPKEADDDLPGMSRCHGMQPHELGESTDISNQKECAGAIVHWMPLIDPLREHPTVWIQLRFSRQDAKPAKKNFLAVSVKLGVLCAFARVVLFRNF